MCKTAVPQSISKTINFTPSADLSVTPGWRRVPSQRGYPNKKKKAKNNKSSPKISLLQWPPNTRATRSIFGRYLGAHLTSNRDRFRQIDDQLTEHDSRHRYRLLMFYVFFRRVPPRANIIRNAGLTAHKDLWRLCAHMFRDTLLRNRGWLWNSSTLKMWIFWKAFLFSDLIIHSSKLVIHEKDINNQVKSHDNFMDNVILMELFSRHIYTIYFPLWANQIPSANHLCNA